MSLTPDFTPKLGAAVLVQIFGEAVRLFEAGNLKVALRYFNTYISAGGPKESAAREYLHKIGARALHWGKAYHDAELWRHAKENYTLVLETGLEAPAAEAREKLRAIPPPVLPEFKAPAGPKPAAESREWRRPHMKLSNEGLLKAGDSFKVDVYADQSGEEPGEESSTIDLPGGKTVYALEVTLLATPHFHVYEPATQPFRIEHGKIETEKTTFDVEVVDAASLKGLSDRCPSLCATFKYRNRPAGKVQRTVKVAGITAKRPPAKPADPPPPRDSVIVEPGASPADLTITIAAQTENDYRHFWCTIQTNLLPEYRKGVKEEWVTAKSTQEIVAGYLQDFAAPGLKPVKRLARLRGAGIDFFDASPKVFRDAFWKLIDSNVKLRSIAIVSSEPFMPWELMIPHRAARGALPVEYRDPLGVEFRVGRMTRASLVSGAQKFPLDRCYVVAPVFEGPNSLPHAQAEAQHILKLITGDAIDPADLDTLNARLETCPSLVHFACHGDIGETGQQEIYLGEDESMSALELRGLKGPAQGVPKARPLIFLNACKAGQPVPALVGVGGLAAVFADFGAGAVVAPLWSVKDSIAHLIAIEFYDQVTSDKSVPFSEILRKLRAKAYHEPASEDTYAAYCFYGDPLASPA